MIIQALWMQIQTLKIMYQLQKTDKVQIWSTFPACLWLQPQI